MANKERKLERIILDLEDFSDEISEMDDDKLINHHFEGGTAKDAIKEVIDRLQGIKIYD